MCVYVCVCVRVCVPTLFDQTHVPRRALLPQAEAVAALGAAGGGVLWGDAALALPRHPLHLPGLLVVGEGTLPLLALRRCGGGDGTQQGGKLLDK